MNPGSQPLPRDPSRLTRGKKAVHPGVAAAKDSWHKLHGTKFAQNAGRGFKKKNPASE